MQTTQLIAQITLIVFIAIILFKTIRKRKKEPSSFNFWMKILAIITLFVWLYFAGAFDRLINPV